MFRDKWLGSRKTPEERAAARVARMDAGAVVRAAKAKDRDLQNEEKEKHRDANHAAREEAMRKGRRGSIEKAIIKITDIGFVTALAVACLVAYVLDMIFFFQQAKVLWLSLLMCALGFIFRTIAICGGVMLEWAEEDEAADKVGVLDFKTMPIRSGLRWVGRTISFSTARMTLRVTTWACWIVCVYATVSFFSSGHEMRKFAAESVTALESVQVVNAESVIADIRTQNAALDKDKQDIRADRDLLIAGARKSLSELQLDGNPDNDNLPLHEGNIKRYNDEADRKLDVKDSLIETNNKKISDIQTGKGNAHIEAQEKKTEVDPSLAVYSFLATITGWTTDGWTIGSAILFALVFEVIVDTGLKNYFRLKRGFKTRLRKIEMRQVVEDANWDLSRFSTISAANLANARARAQAAAAAALQERELADISLRTDRERSKTEAARNGVPWLDPAIEIGIQQRLAEAEADKRIAAIEAQIRAAAAEAAKLRNPAPTPEPVIQTPSPPPPPPIKPLDDIPWWDRVGPDGKTHMERMADKSRDSRDFDKDDDDIQEELKIPTDDWRTRFDVN